MLNLDFSGKVVLVTGGGAGIGRAIVQAFVELGATVVVAEIDQDKCVALMHDLGHRVIAMPVDVRDAAVVARALETIEARLGRLDVVVNNVGHHLFGSKPFEDTTEEEWEAQYAINLRHMFIVSRAAIPLMKRGRAGSIINLSSIEGFRGFPSNVPYTTFKHAVTGFTRSLAMQLAPFQIRVNCIGPETTDSEQVPLDRMIRAEKREAADRTLPMGRFGTPEDHAGVAVFLASDLSGWITGSCLVVDGGGLCAGGFQRTPQGDWTIIPEVVGKAM